MIRNQCFHCGIQKSLLAMTSRILSAYVQFNIQCLLRLRNIFSFEQNPHLTYMISHFRPGHTRTTAKNSPESLSKKLNSFLNAGELIVDSGTNWQVFSVILNKVTFRKLKIKS